MTIYKNRFLFASLIALSAAAQPVSAGFNDWADMTAGQESSGYANNGYAADNGAGPNDPIGTGIGNGTTAAGRYQILIANASNLGYIEPGASDWDEAVYTDKAVSMGVNSYEDMLGTSSGAAMQDAMAADLASEMWGSLNSNATGAIGQSVNGVPINEAGLLGGAWFLGPGAINDWADSGFSEAGLANIDNIDGVLAANGFSSTAELQAYLMNRMDEFDGVDISDITDGTYTPGEGGEFTQLVECETNIQSAMQENAAAYVDGITAAAQDDTLGFSQMQQPFGEMSCIDFAFTGGMDVLFSVPSISDIASQVTDMACNKVNSMVSEQTAGLTQNLQEMTSAMSMDGMNMGPLGNFGGVQTSFNPNSSGINIGTTDGMSSSPGGSPGGFGGINGAGSGGAAGSGVGDGLNGLFVQQ